MLVWTGNGEALEAFIYRGSAILRDGDRWGGI